jgi:hypothetical protein
MSEGSGVVPHGTSVSGRKFAFQRMLLRQRLKKAARRFLRDVVKFALRHPAQISRTTDAVQAKGNRKGRLITSLMTGVY